MTAGDYAHAQALGVWKTMDATEQAAVRDAVRRGRPDLSPLPDSSTVLLAACLMQLRGVLAPVVGAGSNSDGAVP